MLCSDPFCWHCSSQSGLASESGVLAVAFGHPAHDLGGLMLEPAVVTMTSKPSNLLAIAEIAISLQEQFWGVLGVNFGA